MFKWIRFFFLNSVSFKKNLDVFIFIKDKVLLQIKKKYFISLSMEKFSYKLRFFFIIKNNN